MGVLKYDESYLGNKYNFLTVIGYEYDRYGNRCFKCRCDCGNEVLETPKYLIDGVIKSCGCKQKELLRQDAMIHGACSYGRPERLYRIYRSMIERCYNRNNVSYGNYGGRGITVCKEWKENYSAFKTWAIENGYKETKSRKEQSIDRIDNDKGYEPSNCRWTTMKVQRNNQRPRKEYKKRAMIIYKGQKRPKRDVCKEFGISVETFDYRVKKKGMDVYDALTLPLISHGRPKKAV